LEISRWLYNQLLKEINKAKKEGRKIAQKHTTQALIVISLVMLKKEENHALKNLYSEPFLTGK